MFSKIKKRNGNLYEFNSNKIKEAILKAGLATNEFDEKEASLLTIKVLNVAQDYFHNNIPCVEEIQDIVEEVLLASQYKLTAKAYILYREKHSQIRDIKNVLVSDVVDNYLNRQDWKVKENSNMGYSLQGLNNYISSEISSMYWLNKIYTPKVKKMHINGDFHVHDLNSISVYCVGWDLHDLLLEGFKGAKGKVQSNPPKHLRTALGQMANFFYTLQGEAAGAQAFSNFDTLLSPFIYYDKLNYNQVKQCIQEFVFNLNVPTRVGFQTPFTNLTLDLEPDNTLKNQNVIIGGKLMEKTYGDFKNEMALFNRAFLEVMSEGDALGRVFTFPIPTYNITKDFDFDLKEYDLLWEVTGKYGLPYFSNFVNSDMSPDQAKSMCCRLRLDLRELDTRGGGLFGSNPLTGSIGVVTINMPRLGFLSGSTDDFLIRLNNLMNIAKESLETKRKILERLTKENLYPYSKYYLRNIYKRFGLYWKNHFSTIGLIGLNEACINMFGKSIASNQGREFSLTVLGFMREKLIEFQKETGNNYNLEATPAEGTSYRLARIDKEKYPGIITASDVNDKNSNKIPYYTNSSHLPVNFSDDIFEVLDLQDDFQSKYTGGTVQHLYIGERISDHSSIKSLIKTICTNYKLPYFTISPVFSICQTHGYINGEKPVCPICNEKTEVWSRVVGYLRPVSEWNEGKQEEYKQRKLFNLSKKNLQQAH